MTTQSNNDPIVIGFEQVQEAARVLGITDLENVREIQMTPGSVRVIRVVRDEHGGVQYEPDSFELETVASTIHVVVDEQSKVASR